MKKQNYILNHLSQMRHDIWMWMALSLTSEPARMRVEESGSTQGELEYLFENPTGNELDIQYGDELYLLDKDDLDNFCFEAEDDNFGYDRLPQDLDFDPEIW